MKWVKKRFELYIDFSCLVGEKKSNQTKYIYLCELLEKTRYREKINS